MFKLDIIMQRIAVFLFLISLTIKLSCQETKTKSHEVGLDLLPTMILMSGYSSNETEYGIIYNRILGDKNIRVRLNINNKPIFDGVESLYTKIYTSGCEVGRKLLNLYEQRSNYELTIGYAKEKSFQRIRLYYGVDLGVEFNRSYTKSIEEDCMKSNDPQSEEILRYRELNRYENEIISLKINPILGIKLKLAKNLKITVEFKADLASNLGYIKYEDEEGVLKDIALSRLELRDDFLNEIGVLYEF